MTNGEKKRGTKLVFRIKLSGDENSIDTYAR